MEITTTMGILAREEQRTKAQVDIIDHITEEEIAHNSTSALIRTIAHTILGTCSLNNIDTLTKQAETNTLNHLNRIIQWKER